MPYGVGIGWLPWGETMERWRVESGKPELNLAQEFGFDNSFACPALYAGIFPEYTPEVLAKTEDLAKDHQPRWARHCHAQPPGLRQHAGISRIPGEDAGGLGARENRALMPGHPRAYSRGVDGVSRAHRAKREAVQVGWFPYGAFGTPRDLMGAEELLIAFYTEPAMVRDMMETLVSLWLSLCRGGSRGACRSINMHI